MTDLTPLFTKCVEIVQSELGNPTGDEYDAKQIRNRKASLVIHDTFVKEANELYKYLVEISQFITQIRSSYLSTSDGFVDYKSNSLSIDDKNKIDEEFKYRAHQLYEKLKLLQTYEKKRQQVLEKRRGKGIFSGIFGGSEFDDDELFETTIGSHRTQILRFLNEVINAINKNYELMQRKRYDREKQLSLLNFQNLDDDIDLNYEEPQQLHDMEEFDSSMNYPESEENSQVLTQEQIQELDSENQQFLNLKTNQLKQVEKLHNSMVDIVSLQAELSYQLEVQSDQITNLIDNQSEVEIDLQMGNQNLTKATSRNKKGANMLITTCMVLGFLILIVDYLSF